MTENLPELPDGWELAEPEKRVPKKGESYWSKSQNCVGHCDVVLRQTYWIIRHTRPAEDVGPTLPEGWELAEPEKRLPKKADWFWRDTLPDFIDKATKDFEQLMFYIVRRKKPAEDEPKDGDIVVTVGEGKHITFVWTGKVRPRRVLQMLHKPNRVSTMSYSPQEARQLAEAFLASADECEEEKEE